MKDASIGLHWFGVPCHCRCRHCLLTSGGSISTVPFVRAKRVVERFLRWRNNRGGNGLSLDFVVGYSYDFPQLIEYIQFYRESGMTAADCLQVNGIRNRTGDELRRFLDALKSVGITQLGISFYGFGSLHDEFARRDGDFDFLMDIARAAADCSMQRFETIFMWKKTMQDLPALLSKLDVIPGSSRRYLVLWDYRGRGKLLKQERPELSDIKRLPEYMIRFFNRSSYKTEAEWVKVILTGAVPDKKNRHHFISIWEDNIQELETEDCDQIIYSLRQADDAFKQSMPSLVALADLFGQRDGQRVYALRDLEWKWQDMYLDQHPEIDASARFDDLKSCVLMK